MAATIHSMTRATIATCMLLGGASPLFAQTSETETAAPPPVSFSFSAGGEWTLQSDFDDADGNLSVARIGGSLAASFKADDANRVTITLGEELSFYDFSSSDLLAGGADPLDSASQTTLAAALTSRLSPDWTLITSGEIRVSAEPGADLDDGLSLGGVALGSYRVSDALSIGAGVLVRTRLEDDVLVVPIASIRWQIDDRWSLGSEGNAGGVRLRLAYASSETWTFFADAGYEGREFRLDDDGPVPSGVLRETRLPVALGATWEPTPDLSVRTRAGMSFLQSIEIENASGAELADTDLDAAPFVSLMISLQM